jgi:hypothetical protein
MVFIQYLMALAVCEAVDDDGRLGVRIKWPNDIYADVEGVGGSEVGSGKRGKAKLGGILVNTNFVNGKWRIVIGKWPPPSSWPGTRRYQGTNKDRVRDKRVERPAHFVAVSTAFPTHDPLGGWRIDETAAPAPDDGAHVCKHYELVRAHVGALYR